MIKILTSRVTNNYIAHWFIEFLNKSKKVLRLSVFPGWAALVFCVACEENVPGDTGIDILPPEEQVEVIYADTFQLALNTRIVDDLPYADSTRVLFGNHIDPHFGRISAGAYLQFYSPDAIWTVPNTTDYLLLDSLVLRMDLVNAYGRFDTPQRLKIHEIVENFPLKSAITSTTQLRVNEGAELSASYTIDFSSEDDSILRSQIVRLSDDLGNKMLYTDPANYATDDVFQEFFKGLYIATEKVPFLSREPGAVFDLDVSDNFSTYLTLFYRSRSSLSASYDPDTVFFEVAKRNGFFFDYTTRFSQIKREEYEDKLLGLNKDGNKYEFLQSGRRISGIDVFLKNENLIELTGTFPTINNLSQGVGINEASLKLYVDTTLQGSRFRSLSRYLPPDFLQLYFTDDKGKVFELEEIGLGSLLSQYNAKEGSYTFSLAQYMQSMLNKKNNLVGFVIRPSWTNTETTIRRIILGGTEHPTLKPELIISYTRLKQ